MKTRLLGAAVLIALAVIFVPMFFSSNPTPPGGDKNVSLDIPSEPATDMQTRTMDLSPAANGSAQAPPVAATAAAPVSTPPAAAAPQPAAAPPAGPVIADRGHSQLAQVEIASRRPVDVETGSSQPVIPDRRRHPQPTPAVAAAPVTRAPTPSRAATPAVATAPVESGSHARYSLNLSAYASSASARHLISRVQALGYGAQARAINQSGRTLALVTAGPFDSRAAAEAARLRITQSIPGVPARVQSATAASPAAAPAPAAKAAPASAARAGGWAVQLAAMGSQGDANALRDRLRGQGFDAYVDTVNVGGKRLWRVRAGPQTQRADAARLREQIHAKLGLSGNIVSAP